MSRLYLKKYVSKNKMSKSFGKTYARLQAVDTLNIDDLCRHIQKHGSVFTAAEVKGVTEKFVACIGELLLEGYKVKLDGLGTFYLSVSSTGEENGEEFTPGNIRSVRIRFLGDRSKVSDYATETLTRTASFRILDDTPAAGGSGSGGGTDNEEEAGEDRP